MTKQALLPCPFCEGPPVSIVTRPWALGGGVFPDTELQGKDGFLVDAYVFCHECGARGETLHDRVFNR
ncbi:MAG: Lar family restriction alleviation protein, partial [Pyrinomonadaceae bacterium]